MRMLTMLKVELMVENLMLNNNEILPRLNKKSITTKLMLIL